MRKRDIKKACRRNLKDFNKTRETLKDCRNMNRTSPDRQSPCRDNLILYSAQRLLDRGWLSKRWMIQSMQTRWTDQSRRESWRRDRGRKVRHNV